MNSTKPTSNWQELLGTTVNLLAVLTLILGIALYLFPEIPAWAPPVVPLVALPLFLFIAKRGIPRINSRNITDPKVLLIGGGQTSQVMIDISNDDALAQDPYLRFKPVTLPLSQDAVHDSAATVWAAVQGELESAAAAILMSDFTRARYPELYDRLGAWRRERAIPIARYYGEDELTGEEQRETPADFPVLPFHTQRSLVYYASEELLATATARGRELEKTNRKMRRFAAAAAVVTLGLVGSLTWHYVRDAEMLRESETPEQVHRIYAQILLDLRRASKDTSLSGLAFLRPMLNRWAAMEAGEVGRIFADSEKGDLYVYALRADSLVPVVNSGTAGFPLSATHSIAGCARLHHAFVLWEGRNNSTSKISAWNFDGTPIGNFEHERLWINDKESCEFDSHIPVDPKRQILCLPVGIDASATVTDDIGVACLTIGSHRSYMSKPLLRDYFKWEMMPLGLIDVRRMLPDSNVPGKPNT